MIDSRFVEFAINHDSISTFALAAVTALTIRLTEHAGLSAIFFGGLAD